MCGKNIKDLLSQQLPSVQYNIVDYSHHAVYYIPSPLFLSGDKRESRWSLLLLPPLARVQPWPAWAS